MPHEHHRQDDPDCPEKICPVMRAHKDGTHSLMSLEITTITGAIEEMKATVNHIPFMRFQLWFLCGASALVVAAVLPVAVDRLWPKHEGGGHTLTQSIATITAPATDKFQASSLSELR